MVYITYCRNQRSLDVVDTTQYRLNAKAGSYRPTYLLRISDWTKVPGHEAINGYCALSYVWAQSGEVVKKQGMDEYDLVDLGKHCIVEGHNIGSKDKLSTKIKRLLKINNNTRDATIMTPIEGTENEYVVQFSPSKKSKATIRHVTYEELLQQLCKDYQIEYLWYDKICIDQSNKEMKHREIKNMHRIYANACYTVAMIPELFVDSPDAFETTDPLSPTEEKLSKREAWYNMFNKAPWWRRSWTLEEVMSSRHILVIGADTRLWQHSAHTSDVPTTDDDFSGRLLDFANQHQGGGSVNQALSEAHFRTSTKEHDKVFSLASIFHEMFQDLEISYKTNIKTTLNYFYRTIAIHDLSILCFGFNRNFHGFEFNINTMRGHDLPSWTGVEGRHLYSRVATVTTWLHSPPFIHEDDMLLRVPAKYYKKLTISPYLHGYFSPLFAEDEEQVNHHKNIFMKRWEQIVVAKEETENPDIKLNIIDWSIIIFKVTNCNATHYYQPEENASVDKARPLSLTDDCKECFILPILLKYHGLLRKEVEGGPLSLAMIDGYHHYYFLPVFKKCVDEEDTGEERYKAIGLYYVGHRNDENLDSGYNEYAYLESADPDEILKTVFGQDATHDEVKEFLIQ